jgi:large subunit ribosomal protein L30
MSTSKKKATGPVLKLTQVRSAIGTQSRHRGTLRSLGLGTIGKTVEREDSPQLQGQLRLVSRLVRVEETSGG